MKIYSAFRAIGHTGQYIGSYEDLDKALLIYDGKWARDETGCWTSDNGRFYIVENWLL